MTGFGENILVQIGWHGLALCGLASGDLVESDKILTVISIPLMVCQAWLQRQHCNWSLAAIYGLTTSIGSVAGVALLYAYDNIWMKRVLGFVLLFVFIWS